MRSDSTIHWSAYPALLLAGTFAAGILLEATVGHGGIVCWGGGALVGVAGVVGAEWWDRRRLVSLAPLARIAAAALLGLCAGGARHALYHSPSPRSLAPVADSTGGSSVELIGVIDDAPHRSGAATRFTVAVDSVKGTGSFVAVDGRVRVTLRPSPWDDQSAPFPRLYQADRIRLRGLLRPAPSQRNPGGFDYAAYLSRRGTCCTMYVGHPEAVALVERSTEPVTGLIVAARRHIRQQIDRFVPNSDGQAVLLALLLGNRSRISDAQQAQFAKTGLMHLLAVSGLHVFLVGMVFYMLLRPLLMRLRLSWRTVEGGRAALTIGVLCFYMTLTGARPSVVRAVVMSALFIGSILFQRSSHPLNTLGVAALVLLAVRPPALFDVGFQLSMVAVAAIVSVHPRLMEWVPPEWTASAGGEWLVSTVSVSAAATIGTAPVLLLHFGWVSGAGLILNVLGIPCTGLALSAAVGMVVLGSGWSVAGAAFGSVADLFVRALLLTSRAGADWFGWAGVRMGEVDPWVLGATVAGTVALAQWPRPRHRWRSIVCALLLLTGGVWSGTLGREAAPTLDVLFFDVGQGDAVLVTAPDERRMLVDTGPSSLAGSAAISHSVLPYLERRGVDHLETVVITHPDGDHLGGLRPLLRRVSVGQVLHSGQQTDTELYRRTRRALRRRDVPHQAVRRGDVLSVGSHVRIQVLGPPADPTRRGIEGENEKSVVLHLAYGKTDILLPGDIESRAEHDLVRTYDGQLSSRIVKVPHHGSETSSTWPFVRCSTDSAKGTQAVVSVGRSNRFGMPSPKVLARWHSVGAQIRSTARGGVVWLRTDGREVWSVRWGR